MRLICYSTSNPALRIIAAPLDRPWMDDTPLGYAYRCLPLNIANTHGWQVLNPEPFVAEWNGGPGRDAVSIRPGPDAAHPVIATSQFGAGIMTLAVCGLFRTEPGYDLWVGGPSNLIKDAIQPLTGVVETDWSPFPFTMNYKFTRPFTPVSFARDEPYCMFFPLQRGLVETIEPELCILAEDPEADGAYRAWSESRRRFYDEVAIQGSAARQQKWQKDYFKGSGRWGEAPADHRTKVKLNEFK